ncbi:hypothetical protein R6Q59_030355 [Mikania micrantha]
MPATVEKMIQQVTTRVVIRVLTWSRFCEEDITVLMRRRLSGSNMVVTSVPEEEEN